MSVVERPSGTRSRAGNAMGRARAGVLDGAMRSVVKQGTRATTMGGIATLGGVAKATVYNHFRTKDDVFAALVAQEIDRASEAASSEEDLEAALVGLFDHLAEHPARATLAGREPDVLARLAAGAPLSAACRQRATAGLSSFDVAAEPKDVDLVLRVAATVLLLPGSSSERADLAGLLAAGSRTPVDAVAPSGERA